MNLTILVSLTRRYRILCGLLALPALAACSTPPDDPVALAEYREVNDPLEPANRLVFSANMAFENYVLQPVALAWRDWTPDFFQQVVRNLVFNARLPLSFIHALLQDEPELAGRTAGRFVTNALFLWTANIDNDAGVSLEDAGQTIAVWTSPQGDGGPYIMLPLLGPSSPRDVVGRIIDFVVDPMGLVTPRGVGMIRTGAGVISNRANNVGEVRDLEKNALDFYAAVRSLHRQRRLGQVMDTGYGFESEEKEGDFPSLGEESDLE